jgi:hypothetical protein
MIREVNTQHMKITRTLSSKLDLTSFANECRNGTVEIDIMKSLQNPGRKFQKHIGKPDKL